MQSVMQVVVVTALMMVLATTIESIMQAQFEAKTIDYASAVAEKIFDQ